MRFCNDVPHARRGLAADQSDSLTTRTSRHGYTGSMRGTVADGRWRVGNCTSVLVPDPPRRFAADEHCGAGGTYKSRTMHCGIAKSGGRASHYWSPWFFVRVNPLSRKFGFRITAGPSRGSTSPMRDRPEKVYVLPVTGACT